MPIYSKSQIDRAAEARGISARMVRDAKKSLGDRLQIYKTDGRKYAFRMN